MGECCLVYAKKQVVTAIAQFILQQNDLLYYHNLERLLDDIKKEIEEIQSGN